MDNFFNFSWKFPQNRWLMCADTLTEPTNIWFFHESHMKGPDRRATEQTIEDLEQKGGGERERYQVQITVPQDIDKIMRLFI